MWKNEYADLMKMSTKERDLVGRLLKQSILTVCKEAVSYNHQLEIDGIICISLENEEKEIVVKVHELFKKNFDSKTNYKNNESNEIKSQQQMLNGNINEQEIKEEEIRPEDDYTGIKRLETFNDFGNSTGFNLNDEESDSSNSEEMEDMDVIDQSNPNNDDSQVTTSTVIKKPIVNRILTSKFPINKLGRSLLKQTTANHDEKDKSTKTDDDDDMPGYIYNSEAPKPDIKPVRDVECKRCLCIFPDGPSFESHNLNQHNVYTCLVCYNTFTCRNNMKRHMRLHTGYKPYQCTLCSESFTRKDDIKRHLIKHNYSKPFRCNLCDKGYMDRKTIKNHMKKEHSTKLLHCCPTCGESFNDGAKFLKHKKSHPELMVYQCSICNFSGSSPLMYNKHMLIHGQEKTFNCVPCGSVFNDPFRYTSHLKKHRSDDSFESYLCCFCSHCLPTYDQLIKHEHTHVQCKRHTCTVCMKQFRYPSNLREHMLIHSDMSKKIKVHIKKEVLLSTLTNDTSVNEENEKLDATVTKIKNGSTDEGMDQISSQYWCTECQKGFESEDDLTKHISSTHDEFSSKRQDENICTSTSDEAGHFIEAHNDDEDMEASSSDNEEEEFKIPKLVKEVNITPPTQDNIYSLLPTIIKPENGLIDEHMNKTGSEDEDLESELSDSLDHTSSNSSSVSPSLPVSEIPSPAPSMPVFPQNEQDNMMKVMPSTMLPSTNMSNNMNSTTRSPGFERVVTPEVLFRTKEPFECDICKGSFDDFDIFDRHCNSVHRRYICEFCGKQFTSKPNRDRHVRYHTGEKPYKCELCNQSFFRGDDLKYHRTTRHSDIKPFSCSKCRMTFAWAKDLERHLKSHR